MQESNNLPSTPTDGDMIEEQNTRKEFKKAVKLNKINKVLSCKVGAFSDIIFGANKCNISYMNKCSTISLQAKEEANEKLNNTNVDSSYEDKEESNRFKKVIYKPKFYICDLSIFYVLTVTLLCNYRKTVTTMLTRRTIASSQMNVLKRLMERPKERRK
jgi:hypothetical protein